MKLMRADCFKYIATTCKFEASNKNDPDKGMRIWGQVDDPFHARQFYELCLTLVAELNSKFGVDKKGRQSNFKKAFNVSLSIFGRIRREEDAPGVSGV